MSVEHLAQRAAETRSAALNHILLAMRESIESNDDFSNIHTALESAGILILAETQVADLRMLLYREKGSPQKHPCSLVRNGLRFAIDQLLAPSNELPRFIESLQPDIVTWVRWLQTALKLPLSPVSLGHPNDAVHASQVPDSILAAVQLAINQQRASTAALNELIQQSYLQSGVNPLLAVVHQVCKSRSAKAVDPNELLSIAVVRLYSRIDLYRSQERFLGWWHRLVDRCFLDLVNEGDDAKSLTDELPAFVLTLSHDLQPQPFDDDDWNTIRGWAKKNVMIPVVVLVGFSWIPKVRADAQHQYEFEEWLKDYGVQDCNELYDELENSPWTTAEQLRVLAQNAGRKDNTLRKSFFRSFGGIQQTARQSSFGKMHHAVELDYFWSLQLFSGPRLSEPLRHEIDKTGVAPRVAALCCAPAWPLIGNKANWNTAHAGYPFTNPPPLLELLQLDLDIKPEHFELLPQFVRNNTDKVAYIRELILVHATTGKFNQVKQRVRQARLEANPLENELRKNWEAIEMGG